MTSPYRDSGKQIESPPSALNRVRMWIAAQQTMDIIFIGVLIVMSFLIIDYLAYYLSPSTQARLAARQRVVGEQRAAGQAREDQRQKMCNAMGQRNAEAWAAFMRLEAPTFACRLAPCDHNATCSVGARGSLVYGIQCESGTGVDEPGQPWKRWVSS